MNFNSFIRLQVFWLNEIVDLPILNQSSNAGGKFKTDCLNLKYQDLYLRHQKEFDKNHSRDHQFEYWDITHHGQVAYLAIHGHKDETRKFFFVLLCDYKRWWKTIGCNIQDKIAIHSIKKYDNIRLTQEDFEKFGLL